MIAAIVMALVLMLSNRLRALSIFTTARRSARRSSSSLRLLAATPPSLSDRKAWPGSHYQASGGADVIASQQR